MAANARRRLYLVFTHPDVIGQFGTSRDSALLVPSLRTFDNSTTNNMCFGDKVAYTTRIYVRNGAQYSEEYSQPRYGMSWRRKNGLGGSYYPSRYYRRRPSGRYMSSDLTQNRYSRCGGYPQRCGYPQQGYSQYNSYPQGVVPSGYMGTSSGYGRYYPDNRVAMPHHVAMVSLRSFLLSPYVLPSHLPSCTPPPPLHWLA
jgi:hypothetical protein